MSPRQQRMYAAIKGCLLREEAVRRLGDDVRRRRVMDVGPRLHKIVALAFEPWADEQARTLVGVVEEVIAQLDDEEFCARNNIVPEDKP